MKFTFLTLILVLQSLFTSGAQKSDLKWSDTDQPLELKLRDEPFQTLAFWPTEANSSLILELVHLNKSYGRVHAPFMESNSWNLLQITKKFIQLGNHEQSLKPAVTSLGESKLIVSSKRKIYWFLCQSKFSCRFPFLHPDDLTKNVEETAEFTTDNLIAGQVSSSDYYYYATIGLAVGCFSALVVIAGLLIALRTARGMKGKTSTTKRTGIPMMNLPNTSSTSDPEEIYDDTVEPVYDNTEEPVYDNPGEPVYDNPGEPVYDNPGEPIYEDTEEPIYDEIDLTFHQKKEKVIL